MGKKLKAIRILKGLKACDVAKMLNISKNKMSLIENDKVNIGGYTLARLCVIYDVDVRTLLD